MYRNEKKTEIENNNLWTKEKENWLEMCEEN